MVNEGRRNGNKRFGAELKASCLPCRLLPLHMYYYYGYRDLCARSGVHILVFVKGHSPRRTV